MQRRVKPEIGPKESPASASSDTFPHRPVYMSHLHLGFNASKLYTGLKCERTQVSRSERVSRSGMSWQRPEEITFPPSERQRGRYQCRVTPVTNPASSPRDFSGTLSCESMWRALMSGGDGLVTRAGMADRTAARQPVKTT